MFTDSLYLEDILGHHINIWKIYMTNGPQIPWLSCSAIENTCNQVKIKWFIYLSICYHQCCDIRYVKENWDICIMTVSLITSWTSYFMKAIREQPFNTTEEGGVGEFGWLYIVKVQTITFGAEKNHPPFFSLMRANKLPPRDCFVCLNFYFF